MSLSFRAKDGDGARNGQHQGMPSPADEDIPF